MPRFPQILELILVPQRVHRLPESGMLESAKLIVARHVDQRIGFPPCVIVFDVVECARLQDKEAPVHPCAVAGRLFLEARDARLLDEYRAVTAGRLNGGQRRQPAVPAMEVEQFSDVDIRDAIAVSKAKGFAVEIAADALEAAACERF